MKMSIPGFDLMQDFINRRIKDIKENPEDYLRRKQLLNGEYIRTKPEGNAMKLCIDCKHYKCKCTRGISKHTVHACYRIPSKISLIDGSEIRTVLSCEDERTHYDNCLMNAKEISSGIERCKPIGVFWEKKDE